MANIGFIGTGIMGAPMAAHLIKAGHHLTVWNRTQSKLQPLIQLGASACDKPNQAAEGVDVLIVMLTDGPACDDILFGEPAVASALKKNAIVIVMSSIPVETAQRQAEKCIQAGLQYLDAPVSGGEKGAIDGTLAIMVGGKQSTFDQAVPVLQAMGRPVRVGEAGCGELAKLVNQMIVATTIATVSEGVVLAEKGGADPLKILEALKGGFADSLILQQHGRRMISNNFTPGGTAKIQLKDTHTAMAQAKNLHLTLPVASLVDQLFQQMVAAGDGDLDHSGLIREIQRLNQ